jgi:hypothetical protein
MSTGQEGVAKLERLGRLREVHPGGSIGSKSGFIDTRGGTHAIKGR